MTKMRNDFYMKHRIYQKNNLSSAKIEEEVNRIIDDIESLIRQMKKCAKACLTITNEDKLRLVNDFVEKLAQTTNEII